MNDRVNLGKMKVILLPAAQGISNLVVLETEDGKIIEGWDSLHIAVERNQLVRLNVEFIGAEMIEMEGLPAELNVGDSELLAEARRRGYKVSMDDTQIEQELNGTETIDLGMIRPTGAPLNVPVAAPVCTHCGAGPFEVHEKTCPSQQKLTIPWTCFSCGTQNPLSHHHDCKSENVSDAVKRKRA